MRIFIQAVREFCWLACAALILAATAPCLAQTGPSGGAANSAAASRGAAGPANEAELLKSAEAFVRKLFAWNGDFQVKVGPLEASAAPDYYRVPILVTYNGQTDTGEVFISKDGKTMFRGEMYDMAVDPFAATRAKLRLDGDPSKGSVGARVTIVEFSDFECPHCRQLYTVMKTIEQKYPQVRVVYKDFPLVAIHPWAMTAAIAGRCAFAQSPEGFWAVHDQIFENQDVISSENVYEKVIDFAVNAGLDKDAFKVCLALPEAKQAVEADIGEGKAVQINSTPTVFVNGRPVIGGDEATLEQYIQYELGSQKTAETVAPGGRAPGANSKK